jgi:hypothetical protein
MTIGISFQHEATWSGNVLTTANLAMDPSPPMNA